MNQLSGSVQPCDASLPGGTDRFAASRSPAFTLCWYNLIRMLQVEK